MRSEIDSERYLFKQLPNGLDDKIERSIYNRRRRQLSFKIDPFRQKTVGQLAPSAYHAILKARPSFEKNGGPLESEDKLTG